MKQLTPAEATARLEEKCVLSEQSTGEALATLRKWGIVGQTAFDIVQSLVDRRFIDDERFARAYVRDKFLYARWGRVKIRQALRLKGVEQEFIADALAGEIDPEEYSDTIVNLTRAKLRQLPEGLSNQELMSRLIRFLSGRGFEPHEIMSTFRERADEIFESD